MPSLIRAWIKDRLPYSGILLSSAKSQPLPCTVDCEISEWKKPLKRVHAVEF